MGSWFFLGEREVANNDVVNYASSIGANHMQTSAKLNQGIDDIFMDLARSKFQIYSKCQRMEQTLKLNLRFLVLGMMSNKKNKNVQNILSGDFDVTGQQPSIILSEPKPDEDRGSCCS